MDARAVDISDANPLSIRRDHVFGKGYDARYAPDTNLCQSCLDRQNCDDAQEGQRKEHLWPKSLDDLVDYFFHVTMVSLRSSGQ